MQNSSAVLGAGAAVPAAGAALTVPSSFLGSEATLVGPSPASRGSLGAGVGSLLLCAILKSPAHSASVSTEGKIEERGSRTGNVGDARLLRDSRNVS